jgi:hypothetical protein
MDGLSGIKIYNKLNVDTRFLPRAYGDNLDLIVTGVSHKLSNNDWETDIEATVIPKTKSGTTSSITSQTIQQTVQEVKNAPTLEGTSPDYKPTSSDDDLWVYLSWQQGVGGAAQHYKVSTGKRKSYGIKASAIKSNWPGNKVASNGVRKQDIDNLYATNQKKLAVGFIDVWRQHYKEKTSRAITLINSPGKNRTGVLYSDIKKLAYCSGLSNFAHLYKLPIPKPSLLICFHLCSQSPSTNLGDFLDKSIQTSNKESSILCKQKPNSIQELKSLILSSDNI